MSVEALKEHDPSPEHFNTNLLSFPGEAWVRGFFGFPESKTCCETGEPKGPSCGQQMLDRCWRDFFGLTENLSKSVEISQESRNPEASDEIWNDILKITLGVSFTSNEMISFN